MSRSLLYDLNVMKFKRLTYLEAHLIGLIEQTNAVADSKRVHVVTSATVRELIRLHIVEANYALRHDAAVPWITTLALFTWKQVRNIVSRGKILLFTIMKIKGDLKLFEFLSQLVDAHKIYVCRKFVTVGMI